METLQRTANRGSVSTGYDIDNSIMFSTLGTYADSNSYFYHLMNPGGDDNWAATSTNGTNARKVTVSLWFKRTLTTESSHYPRLFDYRAGGVAFSVYINDSDKLKMYDDNTSMSMESNMVFRDTSAWYHMVVAIDQTQSTASNRVKVYVNGEQITSWGTEDYGNQNVDLSCFRADSVSFYIGGAANDAGAYFNGYIAEYHFIDGQQLAQTEFGEFSDDGIWIPKEFTGSYGILGHYYNFSDSSDMGEDFSGNNNDANNRGSGITNGSARQSTDTPTNNFCTMNPLWANSYTTYTEGATNVDTTGSGWMSMASTFAVSKGKWYWEFKRDSGNAFVGIVDTEDTYIPISTAGYFFGYNDNSSTNSIGLYSANGQVYNSPGGTPDAAGFTTSNIVGVAVDMDNYKLYYHIDGTYAGSMDPANGTGGVTIPTTWNSDYIYMGFSGFNGSYVVNFGGYTTISISSGASDGNGYGTFEYAPPTNYLSICSQNLASDGGTA